MNNLKRFSATLRTLFVLLCITATSATSAQELVTVNGTVTDTSGEPLAGVTLLVKGSSVGASTDLDGKFSIKITSPINGKQISVSYLGYIKQDITLNGKTNLTIQMQESAQNLDEVVVIGYGTAKRKDFVGSVSSVKLEDSPISLAPNTSVLESLKGSVSGLDVGYSNSAGGSPGLQIRGQNSISGSNSPLIVVDGVIFMGSMNELNPNDIASIDVLKDATSAAVYGSRSANGVVCITTKKGRKGKPKISFSINDGVQMWACKPDLMTTEQWLESTMDRNRYTDASFLTGQQLNNYNNGISTNWCDLVTRTGFSQDYQAAVSGASDMANYYFSAAYTDTKGIVIGDDWNRVTIKGKFDAKINNYIKIGADASYTRSDFSGNGASLWGIQLMSPYAMPYRANGLLEKYPNGTNESVNPLWGVQDGTQDNIDMGHSFRINSFAEIKIPYIQGLSYKLNYQSYMEFWTRSNFVHENYYTYVGSYDDENRYSSSTVKNYLASANGYEQEIRNTNWVVDNILQYTNTFNRHHIDITAVATRDSKRYKLKQINGSDFVNNGNTALGIDGLPFAKTQKLSRDAYRVSNIGYLARVMYNYNDTYFLTASYRRDGASVFGADTKWGNFGSFGLAWRISNESFMKTFEPINDLKLKVSWGRNGNQGIGAYTTLSKVAAGSSGGIKVTFDNSGKVLYGINQTSIGNSNLGWETTESWNFGIESAWFNNRLRFNLDVYLSKTFDQLFSRTIPVMTGYSSIYASMGEVQNKGVEITVSSTNIDTRDFTWSSALTFWLNRDKLTKLYGEDLDGDGKEDDDLGNKLFIGKSIHSIYGIEQDGIVQETDIEYMEKNGVSAGTPKYVDYNGDGVITADDRHIVGNTQPSFKLNISNTLRYKNFELYAMITGAFGGGNYYKASNKAAYIIGGSGDFFGVNSIYVPYWTSENKSNKYPAATYTGDSYFLGLQSRTYVRLQDISLSYTFDQPYFKKNGLNLSVFVTGKNLITFSGWTGGDPEIGNSFVNGSYPVMKSVSFGANINF
jgi:TonB-linked SusC/RagA family outer membrane protein